MEENDNKRVSTNKNETIFFFFLSRFFLFFIHTCVCVYQKITKLKKKKKKRVRVLWRRSLKVFFVVFELKKKSICGKKKRKKEKT